MNQPTLPHEHEAEDDAIIVILPDGFDVSSLDTSSSGEALGPEWPQVDPRHNPSTQPASTPAAHSHDSQSRPPVVPQPTPRHAPSMVTPDIPQAPIPQAVPTPRPTTILKASPTVQAPRNVTPPAPQGPAQGPPIPATAPVPRQVPQPVPVQQAPVPQQPTPAPRRVNLDEEGILRQISAEIDDELGVGGAGKQKQWVTVPGLCRIVGIAVALALGVLLTVGWEYYRLPQSSRPLHHFHGFLRASGPLGLSFGIGGAVLMLITGTYLVRKKFVGKQGAHLLANWMQLHVLGGLVGPALVLFHAGFLPYSALGTFAFIAMLIVVGSGVLGRYILNHVPSALATGEFDANDMRRRLVVYRRKLVQLGVPEGLLVGASAGMPGRILWRPFRVIQNLVYGDPIARQEFKRTHDAVRSNPSFNQQSKYVLQLARRMHRERQWFVRYGVVRRLIGAWRFMHRWLAILLFVAVCFHIAVAVRYGDVWNVVRGWF